MEENKTYYEQFNELRNKALEDLTIAMSRHYCGVNNFIFKEIEIPQEITQEYDAIKYDGSKWNLVQDGYDCYIGSADTEVVFKIIDYFLDYLYFK